ncbi:ChaN family lipoprotein [Bacteroidota bacterium]
MKRELIIPLVGLMFLSFTKDKTAYRIYNSEGKDVSYSKMLTSLNEADIILFGEHHDNPISHWLERELTGDLFTNSPDGMVLGAEMFEADNQLLLDEYLGGLITEAKFEEEARLWKNYKTDYKPLLKFALDHKILFVATNVPRRYANLVHREGFEGLENLSSEAKKFLPPLPLQYDPELPWYKELLEMDHGGGVEVNERFPQSQAIKDATMGYFILQNWSQGKQFLHFNGAGHSDNYGGIVWYLQQEQPGLKIITITTVIQEGTEELSEASAGKADFIIVVPERMTKTY